MKFLPLRGCGDNRKWILYIFKAISYKLRDALLPHFDKLVTFAMQTDDETYYCPLGINRHMERLKISTSVGLFRVPTEDIAFIEASGNYSDVHLFNGEVVTMTFQLHYFVEAMSQLEEKMFVRVGKSLIVNKNYVYSINITSQDLKLMDHRMNQVFKLKASKEALKELKTILEQEGDNK